MTTENRLPPASLGAAGSLPGKPRGVASRSGVPRLWPPIPSRTLVTCIALGLSLGIALSGTGLRYGPLTDGSEPPQELAKETHRQRQRLQRLLPSGPFVVIDATYNRLFLRRGEEVLLDAVCSSGSGMILQETDGERRWVFDTPRGHFRILNKMRNPIWKKPDWAFVEEGKPIPRDPEERFEAGVLGEYGLYFGDGFLIHGTLYERLLGRSVTHGCIRLGRDDLRQVYETVHIGTPIYIF